MEAGERNHLKAKSIFVKADDREINSGVIHALNQIDEVRVSVERLKTGDYEVNSLCLFERKTIADFANSVMDGRLFAQARRLRSTHLPCALILEGRSPELSTIGMSREALQGAIISVSVIFEVPVLRSKNPEETARLIVYTAHQIKRQQSGLAKACHRPMKRRLKIQLRLLQGLPGIGPTRAESLLNHFGSVAAVMNASQSELKTVSGLGRTTAEMICWALAPEERPS